MQIGVNSIHVDVNALKKLSTDGHFSITSLVLIGLVEIDNVVLVKIK